MDVFSVHKELIKDYSEYTGSLVKVRDPRIARYLKKEEDNKVRWPDPWLSLNPGFESGGTVDELVDATLLEPECGGFFRDKQHPEDPGERSLTLHQHQREALEAARTGDSYVLTTGTGSGKSLAYILPIVNKILRGPRTSTIKAIVVYPMNALANSQHHELTKYLHWGLSSGERKVRFASYTGQEDQEKRDQVFRRPPDILLTNYVMLEYLLTRPHERDQLLGVTQGLDFLVLDELHTYRGRQGADVALLVRRLRDACKAPNLQCIGTSATMATSSTFAEAQETVAAFASRLFGTEVKPDRVIGETLRRTTRDHSPTPAQLSSAVNAALTADVTERDYAELAVDPLAVWIESTFGLAEQKGDAENHESAPRLVRSPPTTLPDAARVLADVIGTTDSERCEDAIQRLLQQGARTRHPVTGRPLFAFRLHQFLSKGDTVYVGLDPPASRYITGKYQVSVPGHRDKALLPLAFCRECGQEYIVVARSTSTATPPSYGPRQDQDAAGGNDVNGYLYVSDDHPWPANPIEEQRLPDSWWSVGDDGAAQVLPRFREKLPQEKWIDLAGKETTPGEGLRAWYVQAPFRFCLRCRVSYEEPRSNDFAKLATFAAEGRSSAVTLVSGSIVRGLENQGELDAEARKLLTFVDNRQDASLQAGHFNDFAQVAQIRAALHRAAEQAGERGLRHDTVAERVADVLDLPITEFAADPGVKFSQKEAVLAALRNVVGYRVYSDLKDGWRVTMPNLEQTGLLRFDYIDLREICEDEECWQERPSGRSTVPVSSLLREATPDLRRHVARILLDEFRRALAVDVEVFTQVGYERMERQSNQSLRDPWGLSMGEERIRPGTVYTEPGRAGQLRTDKHITARGAFGRYLRHPGRFFPAVAGAISIEDAQLVIDDLVGVLTGLGLLTPVEEKRSVTGYRLKSSSLIWRTDTGEFGVSDPLRKVVDADVGAHVNEYFRDLYRAGSDRFRRLQAKEHTAQVPADTRQERERAFREGTLKLLYCSPTMELGVDISSLNAVGMRNVPPTPANYAQRSGRAGRSGQPALVTTYCSTGSAHDQYYFRRSERMVAGSVEPPRLDLANEDLVRSHVQAIWLAETSTHLNSSMGEVVDVSAEPDAMPTLRLRSHITGTIHNPGAQRRAIDRATRVLADTGVHDSSWWYDGWIADVVRSAPARFDHDCDRWRGLYTAALTEQRTQNRHVIDTSNSPRVRNEAKARRHHAETQQQLLLNQDTNHPFSDFYTYRYFASEGFLPGYSFPRLPLAAYIPARRERGTYLQRPRFIAVSEFGPGALIYHEGQRYEVTSIQVPIDGGDLSTTEARICSACGYWHDRKAGTDECEECGQRLSSTMSDLMRLETVFTTRRQRISSDEEERRRAGFELRTAVRFSEHGVRAGRSAATITDAEGGPLAEVVYGDTATVRVINTGRRRRRDPNDVGFWVDPVTGRWLSETKASEAVPDEEGLGSFSDAKRVAKVTPYVEDIKNILILRWGTPLSDGQAVTLRYALERGIETVFQLEDAELSSEPLPDPEMRGRMLFVESAEGGAGVLRRLRDEPGALARVAAEALNIIHVADDGTDRGSAEGTAERCEKGCYDCLLSYTNQRDHLSIDRLSAVDLLLSLANGRSEPVGGGAATIQEQFTELTRRSESELERDLLTLLRDGGYRMPDDAQVTVPNALARPDFVYRLKGAKVAVFVDGPHHDTEHQAMRDLRSEYRLEDLGWLVVRFPHDGDWRQVLAAHPNVFGPGR